LGEAVADNLRLRQQSPVGIDSNALKVVAAEFESGGRDGVGVEFIHRTVHSR